MTNPIELLQQRLFEIEQIQSKEPELLRFKNMYKSTISFLMVNGFGGTSSRNLNDMEKSFIKNSNKKKNILAMMFNVSETTITKYQKAS